MRPLAQLAVVPLVLAALVACLGGDPSDTGGTAVACEDYAVASVMVQVVDLTGAPLEARSVVYRVDGGDPIAADCAATAGTAESCATWVAGYEVDGTFEIEATYLAEHPPTSCCWNEDRQTATVTVGKTDDGCHVVTEEVTIPLDPTIEYCHDTACD